MSLPHAILGFLKHAPATGYELKKTFDATVRHFWPADQSQIYRTLASLVERELVRVEEVVQSGKPNKKIYRITPKGTKDLKTWLRSAPTAGPDRNAALVRVFFSGNLTDADIIAACRASEARLDEELRRYETLPAIIREESLLPGSERDAFFWMLTLEYGLAVTRAERDWIAGIRKRLEKTSYKNVFPKTKRAPRRA
jgi:PadR family transcriptional regulator, regulatory protein AphA